MTAVHQQPEPDVSKSKGVHWTKRPENRAKVQRHLKLMRQAKHTKPGPSARRRKPKAPRRKAPAKSRRAPTTTPPIVHEPTHAIAEHVAYLFGRTEVLIERYADSNGLPVAALAEGLAALLRRSKVRQVLGPLDRVP